MANEQDFNKQAQILKDAGVILADTNKMAVELAMEILKKAEER